MNFKNKSIAMLLLIVVIIFLLTAGFVKKNSSIVIPEETAVLNITKPEKNSKNTPVKIIRKEKFISNDQIREEYGKIETVLLWNGKSYTGAVISTGEIYSIVTVDGIINIPMKDVKMREIIR